MGFAIRAISSEFGEIEILLKEQYPEFLNVISKTGIERVFETRGSATELAIRALNKLFRESNLSREAVGCLIYVTQSPSYFLPSGACVLQSKCDLPESIMAFDLAQGCSGFVQALSIASKLVQQFENVVIVCADAYRSKLDPADRSTALLFSDAASAILVTSEQKLSILAESHLTDGSGSNFLFHKVPAYNEEEFLHMAGADVLLFAKKCVPSEIKNVLDECGLKTSEVSKWFVHQASKLVLDNLDHRIAPTVGVERNLEHIGNTVSSSIPILLQNRLSELNEGINVLCGFGVGLSIATLVIGPCMNE